VKEANPGFDAAELRAFLESRALDMGVPGRDELFGVGKLMLGAAPTALPRRARVVICVVPKLRGDTLSQVRRALRKANCSLGTVRSASSGARKVVSQAPRAGRRLAPGARIRVTLGRRSG